MKKTLIAYFSWSNNTGKKVAEIDRELGFDVARILRRKPYSDDYNTCAYVEAKEERESGILPEILPIEVDVNSYDRILLFFPVWWYTFPAPVGTFVDSLSGYDGEIVWFAYSYTDDPQYITNINRDFRALSPRSNIKEGLFNKSNRQTVDFIRSLP